MAATGGSWGVILGGGFRNTATERTIEPQDAPADLAARFDCGEIILIPAFDRLEDRGRCYELVAEAFGLAEPVFDPDARVEA